MSIAKSDLAYNFLETQPKSAVSILEQQSLEQVAEFLQRVPYKQAAIVVQSMLPQYAARLCYFLSPTEVAGFLSSLDYRTVTSILRLIPIQTQKKILSLLPRKTKINCALLLNYAEVSVGAWMIPDVSCIHKDCNAQEAIALIKNVGECCSIDTLFVVNRDQEVEGYLSAMKLMVAAPEQRIENLMTATSQSVSGRAYLHSIASEGFWQERESVPVINRKKKLVGAIRHIDVRKGLTELSPSVDRQPEDESSMDGIWGVYGNCLLELFDTVSESTMPGAK